MDEHRILEGDGMKVGDLVILHNKHLAIVISRDMPTRTMIKWLEDGVVERLVGDHALQPRILSLEFLQALRLVESQPAILPPPPVVRLLADPSFLQTKGVRRPRPSSISACRSFVTICSVL